jgi:hypothetical protein
LRELIGGGYFLLEQSEWFNRRRKWGSWECNEGSVVYEGVRELEEANKESEVPWKEQECQAVIISEGAVSKTKGVWGLAHW